MSSLPRPAPACGFWQRVPVDLRCSLCQYPAARASRMRCCRTLACRPCARSQLRANSQFCWVRPCFAKATASTLQPCLATQARVEAYLQAEPKVERRLRARTGGAFQAVEPRPTSNEPPTVASSSVQPVARNPSLPVRAEPVSVPHPAALAPARIAGQHSGPPCGISPTPPRTRDPPDGPAVPTPAARWLATPGSAQPVPVGGPDLARVSVSASPRVDRPFVSNPALKPTTSGQGGGGSPATDDTEEGLVTTDTSGDERVVWGWAPEAEAGLVELRRVPNRLAQLGSPPSPRTVNPGSPVHARRPRSPQPTWVRRSPARSARRDQARYGHSLVQARRPSHSPARAASYDARTRLSRPRSRSGTTSTFRPRRSEAESPGQRRSRSRRRDYGPSDGTRNWRQSSSVDGRETRRRSIHDRLGPRRDPASDSSSTLDDAFAFSCRGPSP